MKNDYLCFQMTKIKQLEREVDDLNSEARTKQVEAVLWLRCGCYC